MSTYADRLGYRLETFAVTHQPSGLHLSNMLYHRGIAGVLVEAIATPGFVESFDWSRFACVAVNEGIFRPPTHLVMPNHFRAVQVAWDRAVQMGHRRIGMIIFDEPNALDYHDRRSAFLGRQSQVPASRRLPALAIKPKADDPSSTAKCSRLIDAWIRRHRVDVVLGFNDWFYWLIKDAGWRVPEQVAFISLWKSGGEPTYPGLFLSPAEVGCRAIDWVDSLLKSGIRGLPEFPATMEIDMRWE